MHHKLMLLQMTRCVELFWTFTAHIMPHTSMYLQVTIQVIFVHELLWTQVADKPTAFIVFINEVSFVWLVTPKLT